MKHKRRNYPKLWGYQPSPIANRLGKEGWDWIDAKKAIEVLWMEELSIAMDFYSGTAYQQVVDGKNPKYNHTAADLNAEQLRCLESARDQPYSHTTFPEEINLTGPFEVGAKKKIYVNSYERNGQARKACLEYHGYRCAICELKLEDMYGHVAHGKIHVHHRNPLGNAQATSVDPRADLLPICPNCHLVVHLKDPPYEPDEVRRMIKENSK